jgi:hypothetical protein
VPDKALIWLMKSCVVDEGWPHLLMLLLSGGVALLTAMLFMCWLATASMRWSSY